MVSKSDGCDSYMNDTNTNGHPNPTPTPPSANPTPNALYDPSLRDCYCCPTSGVDFADGMLSIGINDLGINDFFLTIFNS